MFTLRRLSTKLFSKSKHDKFHYLTKHRNTFRIAPNDHKKSDTISTFNTSPMTDPMTVSANLGQLSLTEETDQSDFIETLYQDCFDNLNNMKSLIRYVDENPKTLRGLPPSVLLRIMHNHLNIIDQHIKKSDQMVNRDLCK